MPNPQIDNEQTAPKQVVISTLAARGGVISGRVLTVLLISLVLAILSVGAIYLYFNSTRGGL
jgi:hypothetical protein